ncbi:Rv3235 family protein [Streptomyces sp. NPDC005931]|uniref:Rv3235 family protein n=1 Tax=Streptomyces sp. NPDC005931 TaxID=3364737 RepID=UPI003689803A
MHKVMTRTQHRATTRPPARRDPRRPGGTTPPRRPQAPAPAATERASVRASRAIPTRAGRDAARTPTSSTGGQTAGTAPAAAPRPPAPAPCRPVPPFRPTDHFAELLLAVLSGQRPVHAMLRHTAGRAYDELVRLAEFRPLRTRGARPVVRDIGYYVPREGAIEVFARIGAGDRLRAMAFRLERGRDLRWRCTAVELGTPAPHAGPPR